MDVKLADIAVLVASVEDADLDDEIAKRERELEILRRLRKIVQGEVVARKARIKKGGDE